LRAVYDRPPARSATLPFPCLLRVRKLTCRDSGAPVPTPEYSDGSAQRCVHATGLDPGIAWAARRGPHNCDLLAGSTWIRADSGSVTLAGSNPRTTNWHRALRRLRPGRAGARHGGAMHVPHLCRIEGPRPVHGRVIVPDHQIEWFPRMRVNEFPLRRMLDQI